MACSAIGSRLEDIETTIGSMVLGNSQKLVLLNATCDASAQVLDFVIASGTGVGVTVVASNKKSVMPNGVLGIILSKSASTVCTVLIKGRIDGFAFLPTGPALFVSTIGGVTETAPLTGVVQYLGERLSATEMMFDPKLAIQRNAETP